MRKNKVFFSLNRKIRNINIRHHSPLLFFFIFLLFISTTYGCGEHYDEANKLSKNIDEHLVTNGMCSDVRDCNSKLRVYGGHGNHINFSLYNPDRKILASYIGFIIEHGIEITNGVEIYIFVYPKAREEYGNLHVFTAKPILTLEVKQ